MGRAFFIMGRIRDIAKRLNLFDIDDAVKTILENHEEEILDMNREEQIFKDKIDAKGNLLDTYAVETQASYNIDVDLGYVTDTKGAAKTNTPYNLFWTGESYNSFTMDYFGGKLTIQSNDRGNELYTKWGGNFIFGLTEANVEKFKPIILKELRPVILNLFK